MSQAILRMLLLALLLAPIGARVQAAPAAPERVTVSSARPAVIQSTQFEGGHSRLYFDLSGEWINLTVCANNLPGNVVYAQLSRPGRVWPVVTQWAVGTCVTFTDMDGPGPTFTGTTYTTRAALNQSPNPNWPVPCAVATNLQGLCDSERR